MSLTVRLFGGVSLEIDGRPAVPPERLHGRLLLVYLALHPGPHARGDLAALLWPGMPADSGRANLRAAAASLRRAVGERHLDAQRDRIALADAWVDALAVREDLRAGRLDEALELAGGLLAQGLEASWLDAEREEHLDLVDHALTVLASRAEGEGDLRRAVSYARRRTALDPLAEEPHRELMRLLAAAGDRAAALTVYARLGERLRIDLGLAPSRETRAAAAQLRDEPEVGDDAVSLPAALARAAAAAAQINANADAADLYERASTLLATSVSTVLRDRCAALVGLGEARLRAGQAEAVREPLLEAAAIARRLGDAELLGAAAIGLASVPFFPGDAASDETVIELLREALELTPRANAAARARLLARLARERYFVAGEGEFESLAAEALALARGSGDRAALGLALETVHLAVAGVGDAHRRLAMADEMVRLGEPELELRGRVLRAVDLLELGEPDATAREGELLEALSARLRRPAYRWWPALWRATLAIAGGRLDAGERLAGEALAVGSAPLGEAAELEFAAQALWLMSERGALGDVAGEVDALVARYPALPVLRAAQALAHARAGSGERAGAIVAELARGDFARPRRDPGWLVAAALVAQACAATSDAAHAEALRRALAGSEDRHAVSAHGSVWLGPVSAWL